MAYQHKSGAQKRIEKQIGESACESGRRTLAISNNEEHEQEQLIEDLVQSTSVIGSGSASNFDSAKDSISGGGNDGRNNSNSGNDDRIDPDHITYKSVLGYDIGLLQQNRNISPLEIEDAVCRGPQSLPANFPPDPDGHPFPKYILNKKLQNSEIVTRDWLVWSVAKQALFCFHNKTKESSEPSQQSVSVIATVGCEPSRGYKKLYDRIPVHESSNIHKANYVEWRQLESNLATNRTAGSLLAKQIQDEKQNWKDLLRRFLDVTLFLTERGLAFRGDSHEIGNPRISHYDPLLAVHLEKVKRSQEKNYRLQVHYLSADIQNEFISCCAEHVRDYILKERVAAKYYSIIVDATPDYSHDEQTTFILRYVGLENESNDYKI
nr:uncharacterized protein LOC111419224 [Onthophagus taurus]